MKENFLFQEKQKFTQWWLWLFLIASAFAIIYFVVKKNTNYEIIEGSLEQSKDSFTQTLREVNISSDINWILLLAPILLVFLFFILLRLETKISLKTIHVQYFPFFKKSFDWTEIQSFDVVSYGFVGYGIRISRKFGSVYNVSGSTGLALTLINGKKYLIGTQKPAELLESLNQKLKKV